MSYSNRELVCHYLYYRLSRQGYVWEEPLDSASGSPTPGSGSSSRQPRAAPASSAAAEKAHRVLREVGDSFERQYQQEFADIALQMRFEPDTARGRFEAVAEELFRDGVNWGRVVAFFVFGGTLCVESVKRRDMASLVDNIAAWMTAYLDSSLTDWIRANGDWHFPFDYCSEDWVGTVLLALSADGRLGYRKQLSKAPKLRCLFFYGAQPLTASYKTEFITLQEDAFVDLYGNTVEPLFDIPWPSLRTVLGIAAVGACITFAYLAHQY